MAADKLVSMTYVQLKQECQRRGIDVSGTKDNLVKRLLASPAEQAPPSTPPPRSPSVPTSLSTQASPRTPTSNTTASGGKDESPAPKPLASPRDRPPDTPPSKEPKPREDVVLGGTRSSPSLARNANDPAVTPQKGPAVPASRSAAPALSPAPAVVVAPAPVSAKGSPPLSPAPSSPALAPSPSPLAKTEPAAPLATSSGTNDKPKEERKKEPKKEEAAERNKLPSVSPRGGRKEDDKRDEKKEDKKEDKNEEKSKKEEPTSPVLSPRKGKEETKEKKEERKEDRLEAPTSARHRTAAISPRRHKDESREKKEERAEEKKEEKKEKKDSPRDTKSTAVTPRTRERRLKDTTDDMSARSDKSGRDRKEKKERKEKKDGDTISPVESPKGDRKDEGKEEKKEDKKEEKKDEKKEEKKELSPREERERRKGSRNNLQRSLDDVRPKADLDKVTPLAEPPRKFMRNDAESVYLSCQSLTDDDAAQVAREMPLDSHAKELLLAGNDFTAKGAAVLARALAQSTTLRLLGLGDNPIGDAGATALAAALRTNTVLTELILSNTGITDAGVNALCGERLGPLQRLFLHNNAGITAESGKALLVAVNANPNVAEVSLRDTNVPADLIEEINKTLRSRKHGRGVASSLIRGHPEATAKERKKAEKALKMRRFTAKCLTAVPEAAQTVGMFVTFDIDPAAISIYYSTVSSPRGPDRRIPIEQIKSCVGKPGELRVSWRVLPTAPLTEEVFECEKSQKAMKHFIRVVDDATKKRKTDSHDSDQESAAKRAEQNPLKVSQDTSKKDLAAPPQQGRALMRAFSSSKVGFGSVAERKEDREKREKEKEEREKKDEKKTAQPGPPSLRKKDKDKATEMVITRPISMVHKTHVDREFKWTGESPGAEFQLEQKIGGGAYGSVYRAIHKESGFNLAVKVVQLSPAEQNTLRTEVDMLKKCNDPNIVRYYGTCFVDDSLWILMDYCGVGSLLSLMKGLKRTLAEDEIAVILIPVLKGLSYLHREGIVHRDLKSANILLTENMEPRIADFGVSAQIGNMLSKSNHSVVGTPLFMSPELLDGAAFNQKADIWSLGIMTIELADGQPPYANEHVMRAIRLLCTAPPPKLKEPAKFSDHLNAFVASCLQFEPEKRPSAVELLSDPFIAHALMAGNKELVSLRLAAEFDKARKIELAHTPAHRSATALVDEKLDNRSPARPRSSSADRDRSALPSIVPRLKEEIVSLLDRKSSFSSPPGEKDLEHRVPGNELPLETIDERTEGGAPASVPVVKDLVMPRPTPDSRPASVENEKNRHASPRELAPLNISSPIAIVSVSELKEKLAASERRNAELEAALADARKHVGALERQLVHERDLNSDLGQLLGNVLELRAASEKLERDFKELLAKRGPAK